MTLLFVGIAIGIGMSIVYNYFKPKKFDKLSSKYTPLLVERLKKLGKGPQEIKVITENIVD